MYNDIVGKSFKADDGVEYIVLNALSYKGICCCEAKRITDDGSDGEVKFFQISNGDEINLVSIKSKKILNALEECVNNESGDKPRKIKNGESIPDYLTYLDDFYKTKVINVM